jgi:hypothetical protein
MAWPEMHGHKNPDTAQSRLTIAVYDGTIRSTARCHDFDL